MDIKSWWEKQKFKRAHIPTVQDALQNKPLGEKVFYDLSSIVIANPIWQQGWGNKPYEIGDPPFRASLPWAQDEADKDNVVQSDNELLIIQPKGDYQKYGVLCSNFLFKYGTVRALIKVPNVKGAWSAFWLFKDMPEIDIFEHCGEWKDKFTSTHHWGCSYKSGEHFQSLHTDRQNSELDMHNQYYLFEVEVTPFETIYKINGLVHKVMKQHVAAQDKHIILNVTTGSYCNSTVLQKDAVMHVKWLEVFNTCE